jgi:hypothetical protein
MTDLVAFVRAALDENERAASAIHDISVCQLAINGPADPRWGWECDCGYPARVLAEVAAKRAILDVLTSREKAGDSEESLWHKIGYDRAAFDVIRQLAQPYAGRPGWREEWAT